MMRIAVGIHVHGEPERLHATLDHLRRHTDRAIDMLLLVDGAAAATRRALAEASELPRSVTDEPAGAAACFNRLLRHDDADLAIFLEAGALVGPGWLGHILDALAADARNGLAGPSTNRSWNVQAAFPESRADDIARTAAVAHARFAGAWRTLEPLHCLADFCYAVRREVVQAIGGADEAFGLGPCWEMDYSVRAARAGFRAVWAQGAFVYRRPVTDRRRAIEDATFEASKRHYQDKFCGLRLSGERSGYVAHCRGEECRHFAPAHRIVIRLPLDGLAAPTPEPPGVAASNSVSAAPTASLGLPLVSCIMPTRDRRGWMMQAIQYFQRQDYPERELIIVDDGSAAPADDIPGDPRIRHVRLERPLSIGAKRNHACELARGSIIAHWDDDDWYAGNRLSLQVAPLLEGTADITGLTGTTFFELESWTFWRCAPQLHGRLFVADVHGGTLVFRRKLFERLARYPDRSLAEDAAFLQAAMRNGARLRAIAADDLFLYLRHGANAWRFECGRYVDARGWQRIDEPAWLAFDRPFYAGRSAKAPPPEVARQASCATATAADRLPLVSCIMPTYNRRCFVPKAIEYFLRQDYPRRELVILDDGDDQVADLAAGQPSVRYVALAGRLRLGAKRNAAIEASGGEIILHWDDDDWMDPTRISAQVAALLANDADICGTSRVWFCEIATGRLSVYRFPPSERRWLYGASLCYRRALWQQKPFEPLDIGEDTRFVWALPAGRMIDLDQSRMMIAIVHAANTSRPRPLSGPNWQTCNDISAGNAMGDDWSFYETMCRQGAGALA
jgi:glycosyltransferase involved in cell wall biosynthesis